MSECECKTPGYCPRHKIQKVGRLFELCQTRSDYRAQWDRLAEGKTQPERLSVVDQVKDFLSSTATFIHNGAHVTAKQLYDDRLAICRSCEELQPGAVFGVSLPVLDQCKVCKCRVAIKAAYPHERCPVGLWDSVSSGQGCGGCGK